MRRLQFFLLITTAMAVGLQAQVAPATCNIISVAPVIHAEGLAEQLGDIVIACSGAPNREIRGNLTVFLNTAITNRLNNQNLPNVFLTDESVGAVQPILQFQPPNRLTFTVNTSTGSTGAVTLILRNLRADATFGRGMTTPGFGTGGTAVIAQLAFDPPSLLNFTRTTFTVGVPQNGLQATALSTTIANQLGSPLPDEVDFPGLIAEGTGFSAVRVSEGFASSFEPRQSGADTGIRIVLRRQGFPSNSRVFAPVLIAGSNAAQPTSAGLFAGTVSGGKYSMGSGALLLARVFGADANGAGGSISYDTAALDGSRELTQMAELNIAGGSNTLVYEVVAGNPATIESAQIPVFLGLPRSGVQRNVQTTVAVSLGPIGVVNQDPATGAIPRFIAAPPGSDCGAQRDCSTVLPRLEAYPQPMDFTLIQGAGVAQRFIPFDNSGAEPMPWSARVDYRSGSEWIRLTPTAGQTSGTISMTVMAGALAPGNYSADVIIDAGIAGVARYPVTLRVTAAPLPQQRLTSAVNAASFGSGPLVAGSMATLRGSNFGGSGLAVTFDGRPARILFSNSEQINVLVPRDLPGNSSQVVVSAAGVQNASMQVDIAPVNPGIFTPGILNQDNSVNSQQNPAQAGSYIQIYATGLLPASGTAAVEARVHDVTYTALPYAGPAPGVEGLHQVNLQLREYWPTMTTDVALCSTASAGRVCSPPVKIYIQP